MGADERFRRAKAARERNQFDGMLAQGLKDADERALPSDKFGLPVRPGTLVMMFPMEPMPATGTVHSIQPVLDLRAPAGMLRMRVVYDFFLPAGQPNPSLLVVGEAPVVAEPELPRQPEVTIEKPAEEAEASETPGILLTDAH